MAELRTILPYLRRYGVLIGCGILLVLVANAFSLAPPFLIRSAIDALEVPGAEPTVVIRHAILIVITALLGGSARFGMRKILNSVSRHVEFDLRNDLFTHLLRLDAGFYGRMATGEIMSRATNDIAAVRMVAGPAYMYLANTIFMSIFAISLMVWIDARLTLIAMIPLLALPPITIGFGNLIHRRFESIQARFGLISTMVQENLAGVRIVKAYGQEERQIERFRELADDYLQQNLALARVSGVFHPLLALMSGLAMAAVLLVGGRSVISGSISTGDFVAFTLYLGMLSWPMIALGWVVNLFQRGAASMRRLNRIFQTSPEVADALHTRDLAEIRGEIEFRNVSFRFPGTTREVLRDISFTVPAGRTLAIVGRTGSGKSAIAALLARLYDPTSGRIFLDGVPIDELPLSRLRAAIGMVPQDAFLFSESIRKNLAIGIDPSELDPDTRIRTAAAVARFDDTVDEMPAGYETLLGERGVNLSGGQKQRATLARALARDPRVVVLDDALSAVDTHTEAEILSRLQHTLEDRTSIIISHRVSAVMNADNIIVIENGKIVERGNHEALLTRNGMYASLLRRQILAEQVADDAADSVLARGAKDV